jgi:hypothetical protein
MKLLSVSLCFVGMAYFNVHPLAMVIIAMFAFPAATAEYG